MKYFYILICFYIQLNIILSNEFMNNNVMIINTWADPDCFLQSNNVAYDNYIEYSDRVLSLEAGLRYAEEEKCDGSVGMDGSPDSINEVTLDAIIMDSDQNSFTTRMGAVCMLRNISEAISVAKGVLGHTSHSLLVGDGAKEFALMLGFNETNLSGEKSNSKYDSWVNQSCQPNYFNYFIGDNEKCPPYNQPIELNRNIISSKTAYPYHDTIGMIIKDKHGISCAASSNGAIHKIHGRGGDVCVAGAGCFIDNEYSLGCAETGDGDQLMPYLPTFTAVQLMKQGLNPTEAAKEALSIVAKGYPDYYGAMVCLNDKNEYGGASYQKNWKYSFRNSTLSSAISIEVEGFNLN